MVANWQIEIQEQVMQEVLESDPVYQRFTLASFTSDSNGKGRPPRRRREVNLVEDGFIPDKWTSIHLLKYDELSTEVYGNDFDPNHYQGLDERLRQEIETKARRK